MMKPDKKSPSLRFASGDLVEVKTFSSQFLLARGHGTIAQGPHIVGKITLSPIELKPDRTFLVLEGAQESDWRWNRKLYIEVLTADGPRVMWASEFKMKKGCISDISA